MKGGNHPPLVKEDQTAPMPGFEKQVADGNGG